MKKNKTITSYKAFINEENNPVNEYKYSYQEYDFNQNLIKEVFYLKDGHIETASAYKFNESNVMIEEIHYLSDTDVGERVLYKYYNNMDFRSIETIYSDGSKSIKLFKRNGQVLSVTIVNENNKFEGEEISKFDNQENVTEEIIMDEKRDIRQKFLHEYDRRGLLISTTESGENEEFIVKKIFEYNNKNQMIKETHISERGILINVIRSEYNTEGELILQQQGNKYLIKISYDDKKRRRRDETINLSNNLAEASKIYKYDENDLLTEEISYEMGQQYQLEPGVLGRSGSFNIRIKFHYEFY